MALQHALFSNHPTVMDRIKAQIEDMLDPTEFKRLERSLELIERDRLIRAAFKRLRRQGVQVHEALQRLAGQPWNGEYLSSAQIDWIVYHRQRGKQAAS